MQVQLTLDDSALPLPRRPWRRMPTLWELAAYWAPLGVFEVEVEDPHCFGCALVVDLFPGEPSERWQAGRVLLDRAHLVDRAAGGLDGPQNVVPLCTRCHRAMPSFGAGRGPDAIEWVRSGGRMTLDWLPKPDSGLAGCARHGGSHAVADEPQCRNHLQAMA